MNKSKLVRDKIPEIIAQNHNKAITHVASEEEYWQKLKEKLQEEVDEFNEDSSEEELADILEVIDAIVDFKNFDKISLYHAKNKKAKERGRFEKRIILEKIE